jgi:hypothetical protein
MWCGVCVCWGRTRRLLCDETVGVAGLEMVVMEVNSLLAGVPWKPMPPITPMA